MTKDNSDFKLIIEAHADKREDMLTLLRDIISRIEYGNTNGLNCYRIGSYQFSITGFGISEDNNDDTKEL